MVKIPILASGYVTYNEQGLTVSPDSEDVYSKYVLVKGYLLPKNNYFYNTEAEEVYTILREYSVDINSIDNRCRVISLAKQLFDSKSFYNWVALQSKSTVASINHVYFVKDTLRYVLDNKPREIAVDTWVRLLVPVATSIANSTMLDREITGIVEMYKETLSSLSIADMLVMWLSRPNGYADLIESLYAIYGPRNTIHSL